MSYWIPTLQELIVTTLTNRYDIRYYVQNRVYVKELSEVKSPTLPCVSFVIEPIEFTDNVFTASWKFWIWCKGGDSRGDCYKIYEKIVETVDRQRFTRNNKYYTFKRSKEPVLLHDDTLDADYLAASWIVKGITE